MTDTSHMFSLSFLTILEDYPYIVDDAIETEQGCLPYILQWRRAGLVFEVSFGDSKTRWAFPLGEVYDFGLWAQTSKTEHGCGQQGRLLWVGWAVTEEWGMCSFWRSGEFRVCLLYSSVPIVKWQMSAFVWLMLQIWLWLLHLPLYPHFKTCRHQHVSVFSLLIFSNIANCKLFGAEVCENCFLWLNWRLLKSARLLFPSQMVKING